MMAKKDVIEWINQIEGAFVAIDDGGLALIDADDPDIYIEIGGTPIPEDRT